MKMKFKTVDTRTLAGLKYAEWLKSRGWKIIRSGLFLVYFEKPSMNKGQ